MLTAVRLDPKVIRIWADVYGMPESYVAVDVETSGLDKDTDHILQLGWCKVRNKIAIENSGLVINCTENMSDIEKDIVEHRLMHTANKMAIKGAAYEWDINKISKGESPKKALDKFTSVCDSSNHLLSHYGTSFDYYMLDSFYLKYGNVRLPTLDEGQLLDSFILYKAAVCGIVPRDGESYSSIVNRVLYAKAPVSCSMKACVSALNLTDEGVVTKRAHDAIYDAWLSHLVYESLRNIAES